MDKKIKRIISNYLDNTKGSIHSDLDYNARCVLEELCEYEGTYYEKGYIHIGKLEYDMETIINSGDCRDFKHLLEQLTRLPHTHQHQAALAMQDYFERKIYSNKP